MRKSLKPYVGQYVLAKGWLTDWEEINEGCFRLFIEQPTLKKPNKHLLFEEQEKISTEHHLNIFLKEEELGKFRIDGLLKYQSVELTGTIKHYTRSNGTHDFGLYPTTNSNLHHRLNELFGFAVSLVEKKRISVESLHFCEKVMPELLDTYEEELEKAGDQLPTFSGTYNYYKQEIAAWHGASLRNAQKIRKASSNRKTRRIHKIKNFLDDPLLDISLEDMIKQKINYW